MMKIKQIERFIDTLADAELSGNLFNPYSDICEIHDKPNADEIRRYNAGILLKEYARREVEMMWVFEAPSYQGARRSGAPFVNEGMYKEIENLLELEVGFRKATNTESKTAMTSRIAWDVARDLGVTPLIWEALPFHPFEDGNNLSNRRPTKSEIVRYKKYLLDIVDIFQPKRVVAVGRTSEEALLLIGVEGVYVRHPAQGGVGEFRCQMSEILS